MSTETERFEAGFLGVALGFVVGVAFVLILGNNAGTYDLIEDRYTIQELTDAIEARENKFAERLVEIEESK